MCTTTSGKSAGQGVRVIVTELAGGPWTGAPSDGSCCDGLVQLLDECVELRITEGPADRPPPASVGEDRHQHEVLALDREVLPDVIADAVEPLRLLGRERVPGLYLGERLLNPLGRREELCLLVGGVLNHRDDVREGPPVLDRVRPLEVLLGEPERVRPELVA